MLKHLKSSLTLAGGSTDPSVTAGLYRRWSTASSVCLVAFAGLLALNCRVAVAAPEFEATASFGGFGAAFGNPQALAFDEVSGSVYVLDRNRENQSVEKFDAAGVPTPFGSSPSSYVNGNELTGTPAGSFSFDTPSAAQIAVDNSSGPARGDVYLTDSLNHRVDVFRSDGAYLGEIDSSAAAPQSGGEPCGVAVDPSGAVYVSYYEGHIDRYKATDSDPAHDSFENQLENVGSVCYVAVDAAGDVYSQAWANGPLTRFAVSQFGVETPTGTLVAPVALAVGVNPITGRVFVSEGAQITQYDSTGSQTGQPFGALTEARGVAVNGITGDVYVSDSESKVVTIFSPPTAAAPTVVSEATINVSSASAQLQAGVNPNHEDTTCFFEYGLNSSYTNGRVPASGASDIGAGGHTISVQLPIGQLGGGTLYHYRVVCQNARGTTNGQDQTFKTGSGVVGGLPDGRAWEMVSPLDKNGADIAHLGEISGGGVAQSSTDGERFTYTALGGAFANPASAPLGGQYLATRTAAGWISESISTPMNSETYPVAGGGLPYRAFSPDLRTGVLSNGGFESEGIDVRNPPLAPGAPEGYENFYVRDNHSGELAAVLTTTPAESQKRFYFELEGVSPGLDHVVVAARAALTPGANFDGGENLYEWQGGKLRAINVLPTAAAEGETATQAELGYGLDKLHAISDDGSRVFWSFKGGLATQLYVRGNGPRSVRVDENQGGPVLGSGLAGRAQFWTASSDGGRAFFTDNAPLTAESNTGPCGEECSLRGNDLYMYDVGRGRLLDLTPDHAVGDVTGANVQGVLGASDDGSYVYFVAQGVLAAGATSRLDNLYEWHEDPVTGQSRTTFIARLAGGDAADWDAGTEVKRARVTGDGQHIVFDSGERLTGYDNHDAEKSRVDTEVFTFSAADSKLVCVSCNPSGGRPTGDSTIPGGTPFGRGSLYQSRVITPDGSRVFFNSNDELVPQDINAKQDVYEYDGGRVSLISGGQAATNAYFMDSSSNGRDLFFVTSQQLVPGDTDQLVDLYDAREGGGFSPGTRTTPCAGEECLPPLASAPTFGAPSSVAGLGTETIVNPASKTKSKAKAKKKKSKRKPPKKKRRGRAAKGHAKGSKATSTGNRAKGGR